MSVNPLPLPETCPAALWFGHPGQYYTGQSDSLEVTERYLAAQQEHIKPTPVTTSNIIASGCEVQGSKLICFILRPLAAGSTPDGRCAWLIALLASWPHSRDVSFFVS